MRHALARLRVHIDGIETALKLPLPIGIETAQGIVNAALEIAMQIAKYDAFDQAERDAGPVVCGLCRDTHEMPLGERTVACTRCPTPCDRCCGKNARAYCAHTPYHVAANCREADVEPRYRGVQVARLVRRREDGRFIRDARDSSDMLLREDGAPLAARDWTLHEKDGP